MDLHGRMRCVVGNVAEKGALFVGFDEFESFVCEVVYHVSISSNNLAVVIQWGTEVVSPVAGGKSVVFVKASIIGVVGRLSAIMPLPECSSCIARSLEYIGDRGLVHIQAFLSGRDAANAGFRMVSSCQKFSAGRCAHLAYVEILERQPFIAEAIDIGSGEIPVSVDAEITPALVVR